MKHLILITLLLLSIPVLAQEYKRTVGIRAGVNSGVTYRQFIDPTLAYEGILSFRNKGLQVTFLRQRFEPAFWRVSDGFFLTYGYGGHVGFTNTHSYQFLNRNFHYANSKFSPLIGMDGYLGIEYHFPGLPMQVGIDFKPFLELSLYEFYHMSVWDAAFTLKYTF